YRHRTRFLSAGLRRCARGEPGKVSDHTTNLHLRGLSGVLRDRYLHALTVLLRIRYNHALRVRHSIASHVRDEEALRYAVVAEQDAASVRRSQFGRRREVPSSDPHAVARNRVAWLQPMPLE